MCKERERVCEKERGEDDCDEEYEEYTCSAKCAYGEWVVDVATCEERGGARGPV